MPATEEHELTPRVVAILEGQNWTDQPLTERERELVDLTVRTVAALVPEEAPQISMRRLRDVFWGRPQSPRNE